MILLKQTFPYSPGGTLRKDALIRRHQCTPAALLRGGCRPAGAMTTEMPQGRARAGSVAVTDSAANAERGCSVHSVPHEFLVVAAPGDLGRPVWASHLMRLAFLRREPQRLRRCPPVPSRWGSCAAETGSVKCRCAGETPAPYRLPELVACAARVSARSGGGKVFLPGRSCDSVYDLLAGALRGTSHAGAFSLAPSSRAGGIADLAPRGEAMAGQLRDAGRRIRSRPSVTPSLRGWRISSVPPHARWRSVAVSSSGSPRDRAPPMALLSGSVMAQRSSRRDVDPTLRDGKFVCV